jgi:hypothetical protein
MSSNFNIPSIDVINTTKSINIPDATKSVTISIKKSGGSVLNRLGYISIAASILLGCSLMTTGRKEDILDGISIAAGGSAVTALFLGIFHAAKKGSARGAKLLTASVSLAALALISRNISKGLDLSPAVVPAPPLINGTEECKLPCAVYEAYFKANKEIIDQLKTMDAPGPALGAIQGMALLEPHILVRSAWYEHFRFADAPQSYGWDLLNDAYSTTPRPVLLLPGVIGTWNYLADLARALKQAGIPVFVVNIGAGGPTDEKLKKIREKLCEIRSLYANPPEVDIVAHSMGANLGLAAAYNESSVYIDAEGSLSFHSNAVPKANPLVGKVITLANPLVKEEVESLKQVKKIDDFYNIIAKYDGIMGHKQPGLVGEFGHQAEEISASHIGIVFEAQAHQSVINRLT